MPNFAKRIAALALAAAAGCSDSFPPVPGPLDRFYFPVGLAVRRLPAGNTALLVVSSNFDLRYDFDVGGSVLAVDPDASGDALAGDPTLAVLGGINVGSFGGEVAYLAGTKPTEYPEGVCAPLAAADSLVAAGGAKVVVASRGTQEVYRIDMDALGRLACDGCAAPVPVQALDPYGVAAVCADRAGVSAARFFVTHLRVVGSPGLITEVDLLAGTSRTLTAGSWPTYNSTFDPISSRLFVSTRVAPVDGALLEWFSGVVPSSAEPALAWHNVASDVKGARARDLAISSDRLGYLRLELFDYDLAVRSGVFVPTGGALAVYDLTETSFGVPAMKLLRVIPTCPGSGQVRILPARPGMLALVALTCDQEGTLLIYDDEARTIAARIALDPGSGRPLLGRQPFGLAVEDRGGGRARLYAASFGQSWVNVIEVDTVTPGDAAMVKRIGRERE